MPKKIDALTADADFASKLKGEAATKTKLCTGKSVRDITRDLSVGRSDVEKFNPFTVVIRENFNMRDFTTDVAKADLYELAENIAKNGQKKPIEVSINTVTGVVELEDGERRLRAIRIAIEDFKAPIMAVAAIVRKDLGSEADRIANQALANTGVPFTQMENARLVQKLLDFGWSHENIATKTLINIAKQKRVLNLLEMPEQIRTMVAEQVVSASSALKEIADAPTVAAAIEKLERRVAARKDGQKRAMPKLDADKPVTPIKLVEQVIREVKASGSVDATQKNGSVIVAFTAEQWATLLKASKNG